MDSTFISKQGSLNRGHFIIALKFTGAREPACHPAGWPGLCSLCGSGRCFLGGGEINTIGLETGKEAEEILCAQREKPKSWNTESLGISSWGVATRIKPEESLDQGMGFITASNRILRRFDSGIRVSHSLWSSLPSFQSVLSYLKMTVNFALLGLL